MGLKFSKQSHGRADNMNLAHTHQQVIHCLITNFFVRNLVSKKRRRLLVGGYDLDMSYITDRVLAMSFPAERMRAVYRNPLWQVKSVLDMRHQGHYKAGKGRTGLMVCTYLVYIGLSAEEALQLYAQKRTTNNEGVSIPSQRRYVGYWANTLLFPKGAGAGPPGVNLPHPCSRELRRIRLYDTITTESIFFVISELQEVTGDVRVIFYQKMKGGRLFYACFNTAFIRNSLLQALNGFTSFATWSLQFSLRDLDKVASKGRSICGNAFCLELLFGPANTKCSLLPPSDDDLSDDSF
ncbi:hypothetical protein NL676_005208 [Syzygium grande]|nr:hypothetical protein NL676_005208 [Syzygium grande]